jgi:uncharacterized protein (TIGR00730 family)
MEAAMTLGYILGKRGHVCVNGAGSFGCMAAMNDGVALADGHVVGVIHRMWLPSHASRTTTTNNEQAVGAHSVFDSLENAGSGGAGAAAAPLDKTTAATTKDGVGMKKKKKFVRELLVASGDDLQERKRLLVEGADALIVLPGGPGTWDELWEMACAKGIGLSTIPICCINCDDYYGPFLHMLERAHEERLMKHLPGDLVNFVDTPEEAVRWVEAVNCTSHGEAAVTPLPCGKTQRMNVTKSTSFFHDPLGSRAKRAVGEAQWKTGLAAAAFAGGLIGGALLSTAIRALRQRKR